MTICLTPEAARHIDEIDDRWRASHPTFPSRFSDELEAVLSQLEVVPKMGPRYKWEGANEVRRVLLNNTQYHLYYAVNETAGIVTVMAVQSTRRGSSPFL